MSSTRATMRETDASEITRQIPKWSIARYSRQYPKVNRIWSSMPGFGTLPRSVVRQNFCVESVRFSDGFSHRHERRIRTLRVKVLGKKSNLENQTSGGESKSRRHRHGSLRAILKTFPKKNNEVNLATNKHERTRKFLILFREISCLFVAKFLPI